MFLTGLFEYVPRLRHRVLVPEERLQGILLHRFDSSLFFANAPFFAERIRGLLGRSATPVTHLVSDPAPEPDRAT